MAEQGHGNPPGPDIEKILREHQKWLASGQGQQADLSGRDLENLDFRGRDLRRVIFQDANLQGANLQTANLQGANLQGANLQEAQLQGADLSGSDTNLSATDFHNAVLSKAFLQDVNLTPSKNLLPGQLAGTNLTGAQIPSIIQGFLNKPGNLDDVSRITGSLFVTMLSACVYVWLTVFATTDAGLLTNMATSKLPIFSVDIPIAWFYWSAPCLLLSMYVYFHLTLQRQWDGLASLPAVYPDGRRWM